MLEEGQEAVRQLPWPAPGKGFGVVVREGEDVTEMGEG